MQTKNHFVVPLEKPRYFPGTNPSAAVRWVRDEGSDYQNAHEPVVRQAATAAALRYRKMVSQAIAPSELRHVYLVSWWFADFGGMERHMTELAISLRSRGVKVTVLTEMPVPRNNQYRVELRKAGIPFLSPLVPRRLVTWLQNRFPSDASPDSRQASSDPVSDAMGSSVLARILRRTLERRVLREAPDVVHVHGWLLRQWVVAWCASRDIPAIYTEHSTISDWGGPASVSAASWVAQAGDVACVSEAARQSLAAWLPGRRISVHRHIVRLPSLSVRGGGAGEVRLLSVARLRVEKGLDILMRAAAQLRSRGLRFRIEIAGEGPALAELDALRLQLGLGDCVNFPGRCTAQTIHEKMRQSDVFVLPSRTEAMPLALLEAMSHGLAAVATSVGGIPEVISHGKTGLLVPPESAEALADALACLIGDPDFRIAVGDGARRQFEHGPYGESAGVESVLASYKNATAGVLAG
jgi:glycosyltransferase involved in cell wall biosynthesis